MPVQPNGNGFDVLTLAAVALLLGECWLASVVIGLVNTRIKLKSRHAETVKGLLCNCLKYAVVLYGVIFGLSILGVNMVAVSIISIAYDASIEEAEKAIRALLAKLPEMYPNVFPTPPDYLGVEELGSSSVDLKIVAPVDESNIYIARRIMNRELKLALDRAGIEIPFPQMVIHQSKD